MTKTIYRCGCSTMKDGAIADDGVYCHKHRGSYLPSDNVAAIVGKIEGFGEPIFTQTLGQGGQTWRAKVSSVC